MESISRLGHDHRLRHGTDTDSDTDKNLNSKMALDYPNLPYQKASPDLKLDLKPNLTVTNLY